MSIFSPFRTSAAPPARSCALENPLSGQVAEEPPASLGKGSDPTPHPRLSLQPLRSRGPAWWEALSGAQKEGLILAIGWAFAGKYKSTISPWPSPAHLWIRTLGHWRKAGIRQAATRAPATGGLRLGCGNIHGGEDAMCDVWTREEGRLWASLGGPDGRGCFLIQRAGRPRLAGQGGRRSKEGKKKSEVSG